MSRTSRALLTLLAAGLATSVLLPSATAAPAAPTVRTDGVAAAASAIAARPAPAPGALPAAPVSLPAAAVPPAAPATTPQPARPAPAPAPVPAAPVVQAPAAPAASPQEVAQARGEAALASLDYPWQSLGYSVRFAPYTGGTLGSADFTARTIDVFVKPSQSELSLRVTIAHELGHALDVGRGTAQRRRDYLTGRGLDPATAWFGCSGCSDYATPAGDFAEVFALWLVGPGDFRSQVAAAPDAAQLERLVPLFQP